MKILLASSSSGSAGGGEFFLLYLAEGLIADGHKVGLWCSDHERMDGLAQRFSTLGEVLRSPYPNTYDRRTRSLGAAFDGACARRLAKEWKAWNPALVHLNKQNLEDGLELLGAAKQLGDLPAVATVHITQSAFFLGADFARVRDAVARWKLRRSTLPLVAVSDRRREELSAWAGREAMRIYNGVPNVPLTTAAARTAARQRLGLPQETPLVVTVGRLVPQKEPHLFVQTVAGWRESLPELQACWVGDGKLRESFDEQSSAAGADQAIRCVGWQDNVGDWLQAADIYLHTARYEGLPLALLEAMAHGLPCVVRGDILDEAEPLRDCPGLVSLDESGTGLRWLTDETERSRVGAAAHELQRQRFSIASMAGGYAALYARVIGDDQPQGGAPP